MVMTLTRKQYFSISFRLFSSLFIFSTHILSSFSADTLTENQSIRDGQTLISPLQTFELGFFTPGNSKNRYLGIWYCKSPDIVVWVANRNNPITDLSGVLTISSNGNLFLLNQTNNVVWYSDVSRKLGNPMAELQDSGNLVLRDMNISPDIESYLWQSFDHPSDTFLPGMKLGWNLKSGQETYLTSWRSFVDPSPGDYNYRLDNHFLPQLVIDGRSTKMYRSEPWDGISFGRVPDTINLLFKANVVKNEDGVYYKYKPLNKFVLTRVTLDPSGSVNWYVMDDERWNLAYLTPTGICDNYRQCGANAICRTTRVPFCECLKGFKHKSKTEGDERNWPENTNCKRESVLDCHRGEGFFKVERTKLPELLDYKFNENMDLHQCAGECLKNCSCRAYSNFSSNGSGKGCLMWFGNMTDISEKVEFNGYDIYIRVPLSELLNSKKKKTKLVVSISTTVGVLILLGLAFFIRWKKLNRKGMGNGDLDMEVPLFDILTIAGATNNFSQVNLIGEGGFGRVYKGELPTGQQIAVKKLSKNSGQGYEEFRNEVVIIAKLQHRNLVGLIGSCMQGEERMLIYEYMPNKSLDYYIFDHKSASLEWKRRFDIILGIARGLLYLHQDSKLQIIHRDLKVSNILLDGQMNPKILDFGLARIFSNNDEKEVKTKRVMGTHGYMSPEYIIDGQFSIKSDVFSFGVILLEIISGKKNRGFYHPDHHHNLLGHAWLLWTEDRALELMDAALEETCVKSQVLRCIQVGSLSVQKLSEDRPTMSVIVSMLGNDEVILPKPKQPGFFLERSCDVDAITGNEFSTTSISLSILEAR